MVRMNPVNGSKLRRLMLTFSGCLMACTALAQTLEIIDLKYRTAPEVIPILQPLVEPGGALSGSDYKLFVRASAGNVAQLRSALAQIDRQPRQLLVSVRRATRQSIERENASLSVQASNAGSSATVHATESTGQQQGSGVASVQVLEGNSAFIATGQSIPIVTAVVAGARGPWVGASTSYRDLNSGFLVTPRLSGQLVTLNIEQQTQQTSASSSTIQTQSLATQVSGALDQWISLGGVSDSSSTQRSGILNHHYSTQSDAFDVWVKVEER